MGTKGETTKTRILDIAERHILQNGFAATSIDVLIQEAGISKGGFFYHFDSKNDVAYALMQRYRENDALLFSDYFMRAEELTDDPLQQMLIFLKLLAEMMEDLKEIHPGCLVASFTYESHQVNEQVRKITTDSVEDWRRIFKSQIDKINHERDPENRPNSDDLADMLSTVIEGGIIISRALNDPSILVKQILEYRNYIKLLYS